MAKHLCKKYLSLLFGLTLAIALCLSNVSAYQVKYYGKVNPVNISSWNIPDKYFDGIKVIRIYEKENKNYCAYYFNGGIIDIYGKKCLTKEILFHELSHNCQSKIEKRPFNLLHNEIFYKCYEEIESASQ